MDLTGCWYDPAIDGSGLIIDDAPEARVVYWYSYADGFPMLRDPGQMWLVGSTADADRKQITLYKPKGQWMGATYELGDAVATIELEVESGLLLVNYRFINLGPCKPVMVSPVWGGCGGTLKLQRLTRYTDA